VSLIDIDLLRKYGLALTRELPATSNVGIILVTVKNNQSARIVGLTFFHKLTNDFINIYGKFFRDTSTLETIAFQRMLGGW